MQQCEATPLWQQISEPQPLSATTALGARVPAYNVNDELLIEEASPSVDFLSEKVRLAREYLDAFPADRSSLNPEVSLVEELNAAARMLDSMVVWINNTRESLASAEAREAAAAVAAARGMPKCLHWTKQDRKLAREIYNSAIPSDLCERSRGPVSRVTSWCYVRSAEFTRGKWAPGKKIISKEKSKDGRLQCILEGGDKVRVYEEDTLPLDDIRALGDVPDDIVRNFALHEAAIMHVLRQRFQHNRFFCNAGPILISCNPFHWTKELYEAPVVQYYVDSRFGYSKTLQTHADTPPHTFQLAERAFISLAAGDGSRSPSLSAGRAVLGRQRVCEAGSGLPCRRLHENGQRGIVAMIQILKVPAFARHPLHDHFS